MIHQLLFGLPFIAEFSQEAHMFHMQQSFVVYILEIRNGGCYLIMMMSFL